MDTHIPHQQDECLHQALLAFSRCWHTVMMPLCATVFLFSAETKAKKKKLSTKLTISTLNFRPKIFQAQSSNFFSSGNLFPYRFTAIDSLTYSLRRMNPNYRKCLLHNYRWVPHLINYLTASSRQLAVGDEVSLETSDDVKVPLKQKFI